MIIRNKKLQNARRWKKLKSLATRAIGGAAVLTTLITAYLFLVGWVYSGEFYGVFGVDVRALDVPAYAPLVESVNALLPLATKLVPVVGYFVIACLPVVLIDVLRQRFWLRKFVGQLSLRSRKAFARSVPPRYLLDQLHPRKSLQGKPISELLTLHPWTIFLITLAGWVFLALVLFALTIHPFVFAGKLGKFDAESLYLQPTTKTILTFKSDARSLLSSKLSSDNDQGALRLLAQTKDAVVVFVKCDQRPCAKVSFTIPIANLVSVRNEPLESTNRVPAKRRTR